MCDQIREVLRRHGPPKGNGSAASFGKSQKPGKMRETSKARRKLLRLFQHRETVKHREECRAPRGAVERPGDAIMDRRLPQITKRGYVELGGVDGKAEPATTPSWDG